MDIFGDKNIRRTEMMRVRNYSYAPYLEREGEFACPMPKPPDLESRKEWYTGLKPYERLFYHQTLSSVRASKRFLPTNKIPKDSLDFRLQSRYIHSNEVFPERVDTVLQTETCSKTPQTFRVLRNTKDILVDKPELIGHPLRIGTKTDFRNLLLFHRIERFLLGGMREKISPHSVKLINSGPHTQLVNNGYSRQTADGNFFRY
ncbi:SR family splicing factor SC35 isoform 1-T2 [Glossina fuscipes fuscipes]